MRFFLVVGATRLVCNPGFVMDVFWFDIAVDYHLDGTRVMDMMEELASLRTGRLWIDSKVLLCKSCGT